MVLHLDGEAMIGDPRKWRDFVGDGIPVDLTLHRLIAHGGRLWEVPYCPKCGTLMQQVGAFVDGPPDFLCPTHGNADMATVLFTDGSFTIIEALS